MNPLIIIVIGLFLAIIFAIFSMSTGMWGCGSICYSFIGAFWLAILLMGYGILLVIQKKRGKQD